MLGIVMDVLKYSGGGFKLFDELPNESHRKRMGTLLETPNFYHYLSAVQNLKIAAKIKQRGEDDIDRVIEVVGLTQRKNSPFSSYSLGMKQRLAIGSALLGNPEVLVLDEPTNGLDPVGIAEIRSLIMSLASQGKTIIMASHMLDEVEKVCTHVAILKYGKLIASGDVNEILVNEDVVEIASSNLDALKNMLTSFPNILSLQIKDKVVQMNLAQGTANMEAINKFCFDNNFVLTHLQLKKKSLETKFLELTN
jgi:ABC-2 type transport system ATP-binding protein